MLCLTRYDVITIYVWFHHVVLSAIFVEERHKARVVVETTRYDWSFKNLGTQMHNECPKPLVVVWCNEAMTLGTSKFHGASSQLLKGEPLYMSNTEINILNDIAHTSNIWHCALG
jgi:hypothetical protein